MSHGSSSRKKKTTSMDEVDELLRSAQDDMLLKLSIHSHIMQSGPFAQTSSSTIDPDLDRRFGALKSKPKPKLSTSITRTEIDKKNGERVVDDFDERAIFARFAALKDSLLAQSSSSSSVGVDEKINNGEKYDSADEEDEVQKLINWATDAARLDPSPPSDADTVDDSEKDSDSESDGDDEDNHKVGKKRK